MSPTHTHFSFWLTNPNTAFNYPYSPVGAFHCLRLSSDAAPPISDISEGMVSHSHRFLRVYRRPRHVHSLRDRSDGMRDALRPGVAAQRRSLDAPAHMQSQNAFCFITRSPFRPFISVYMPHPPAHLTGSPVHPSYLLTFFFSTDQLSTAPLTHTLPLSATMPTHSPIVYLTPYVHHFGPSSCAVVKG